MISTHKHVACGLPLVIEWSESEDLPVEHCEIFCVPCQIAVRRSLHKSYWHGQGRKAHEDAKRSVERYGIDECNFMALTSPTLLQDAFAKILHTLDTVTGLLEAECYMTVADLWTADIAPIGGKVDDWKYHDLHRKFCRCCLRPKGFHQPICYIGFIESLPVLLRNHPVPAWESGHDWVIRHMRRAQSAHTHSNTGSEL